MASRIISSDALIGDPVGQPMVVRGQAGPHTFTFDTDGNPDGLFAIDGNQVEMAVGAPLTTATYFVKIVADNGTDQAIRRKFAVRIVTQGEWVLSGGIWTDDGAWNDEGLWGDD